MAVILIAGFVMVAGVSAQRSPYDIQTQQTPGYNNPLNVQELNANSAANAAASRQRRLETLKQLLAALRKLKELSAKLPGSSLPATPPIGQDTFAQRGELAINDRVEVTTGLGLQRLNVRHTPSVIAALLGQQATGAQGTITDGPRSSSNITWWYVNFDRGASGWVSAAYLKKAADLKPQPQPQSSVITVISPNGGENLTNAGNLNIVITTIRWSTGADFGSYNVNVSLLDSNGNFIKDIATNKANTGSVVWNADNSLSSGQYKVRVSAAGNSSIQDISDNTFTLNSGEAVNLPSILNISPASGPVGSEVIITGSNFISGSYVKFGDGFIGVSLMNSGKLSFVLPENLSRCAVNVEVCTQSIIPVTHGQYQVAVVSSAGTSNIATFTVTDNSTPTPTDTTPPSAPSNLSATAVSTSQINLNWNASSDNVGVTGYRVYRNDSIITTVTGTSYSNTNLSTSTTYNYRVAALDAAGNVSAQSSQASATTQGNTTPPPPASVEKSITITSPLAGQTLTAGDSNNKITWTSTGFSQVKIELCLANNALACRLLAFGAPASGSWNLPATHAFYPGELEVVVSSMGTNIFAASEIIKRSGVFTMTSPSAALPSDYSGQLASALAVLQSLIASVVASIE